MVAYALTSLSKRSRYAPDTKASIREAFPSVVSGVGGVVGRKWGRGSSAVKLLLGSVVLTSSPKIGPF